MKTTAAMRQLVQLFQICARDDTKLFLKLLSLLIFASFDALTLSFVAELVSNVVSFASLDFVSLKTLSHE